MQEIEIPDECGQCRDCQDGSEWRCMENGRKGVLSRNVCESCEDGVVKDLCLACSTYLTCKDCCTFGGKVCRSCAGHAEGDPNGTGFCCDCWACEICEDNQCAYLDEDSMDEDRFPKVKSGCRRAKRERNKEESDSDDDSKANSDDKVAEEPSGKKCRNE